MRHIVGRPARMAWEAQPSCLWACCVHKRKFNAPGSGVLLGLVCSAFVELGSMGCVDGTEGEGKRFSAVGNSDSRGRFAM